jgi:hypothetical protein
MSYSSSVILPIRCHDMCVNLLLWDQCLSSRCLAKDVSVMLLWLYISDFQATCHNIIHSPMSWSSYWSLSFWSSHHYPIYIPPLPHSCYMPCPSHLPWFGHSIIWVLGEGYKFWSSSLCSFLQPPVTSSLFGLNNLDTLFSKTLSSQWPSSTPIQNHRRQYYSLSTVRTRHLETLYTPFLAVISCLL